MSPIEHLQSVAHENHARFISGSEERAVFGVRPPNASGAPSPEFILEIERERTTVSVRELRTVLLPSFCSERHINPGGTFCLYWGEVEPGQITNNDEAQAWWGKLLLFLLRQRSAAALRKWPGMADARAHGSEAARSQAIAEKNAALLGPKFEASLRDDRFTLRRGHRRDRIALFHDGRRVLTVLPAAGRVMTQRQRCKCDHGDVRQLPIASCGNHGSAIAAFVVAISRWKTSEAAFYEDLRRSKHVCCGTMDNCPLAKTSG